MTLEIIDRQGLLNDIEKEAEAAEDVLAEAQRGNPRFADSLGWLEADRWAGKPWLDKCQGEADRVSAIADTFVVIGVGGSNNSARALLDAVRPDGMRVLYAGNTLSAEALSRVLRDLEGHDYVIDCIAKNFATLEPGASFRVFRSALEARYGKAGARERIICTGTRGSSFEVLASSEGYSFLPFPEDIGGRYTALSPVHLMPMAAGGADIRALSEGAKAAEKELRGTDGLANPAWRYALARDMLYRKGFSMELLSSFEPRFRSFFKWWEQLFAESEGKQGKGLFPKSAEFSEELHSLGQFIQEGSPLLFETFLGLEDAGPDLSLPPFPDDGFGYLDGKSFKDLNKAAYDATVEAHSSRLPCLRLTLPDSSERSMGYLFYFFQFACSLSARLLGVNPFDQPGVEAYKIQMFRKLGKQEA